MMWYCESCGCCGCGVELRVVGVVVGGCCECCLIISPNRKSDQKELFVEAKANYKMEYHSLTKFYSSLQARTTVTKHQIPNLPQVPSLSLSLPLFVLFLTFTPPPTNRK